MQLTLETTGSANTVAALESGRLKVAGQWLSGNLIISADQIIADWPAETAATLNWQQLDPLIALKPEIVLIGSGAKLEFPPASVAARVLQLGIGFEAMDTAAACRTYNILVAEQRRVVAGILQQTSQ